MKISKQQLRQIIKEEASRVPSGRAISPEQAEEYLRSKADSYRRQGVTGKSMEMLLMDDFMDDLGHQHDPEDYEGYIRELVLGESNMKLTKNRLRRLIKEELATVTDDSIEDVVMGVLSDEGGAAGVDPIEDALENLEDDAISLPDEDIEDIIDNVPGVKRHADGDYIDTTQLEGKTMRITKRQLRQIIKEEKAQLLKEAADPAAELAGIVDELRAQGLEDLAMRLEALIPLKRRTSKEERSDLMSLGLGGKGTGRIRAKHGLDDMSHVFGI